MTGTSNEPLIIGPRAEATADLPTILVTEYGIHAVREVRDLGGSYNLNLLIRTDAAAYVARIYRPWVTRERLDFLQETKRVLARAAFPTVEALPTQRGDGMVRVGDCWLEVEPFVACDGTADRWDRYATAFTTLGQLHGLLAEGLPATSFVAPAVSNYAAPRLLEQWVRQTQMALSTGDPSDATDRAATVCQSALECLAEVRTWWDRARQDLPSQPTHGDFGGDNVLFRGSRVVAVLDFDFLARRERVFDLAYSLYWLLRRLEGTTPETYPWRRVVTLLARYDAAVPHPLTRAEVDALPMELARVPLYWIGEASFTADPLRSVLDREDDVRLARWLLRHQVRIRTELRAGEDARRRADA